MVLAETAGSPQPAPVVPVPLGQLLLSSRVGMLAMAARGPHDLTGGARVGENSKQGANTR